MQEVKSYYENEAEEYNNEFYEKESKYPILKYRHNYMLKRIDEYEFPENAKVLDIGCGPGEMVLDLRKHNWEIWGIDIAQSMIDIAMKKAEKRNDKPNKVNFSTGDIENLNFPDNFFDLIICSGVIEYLDNDLKWSEQITRVMKPGGILLINVTNKHSMKNRTAGLVEKLKKNRTFFSAMDFIKQKILRKGKLHYFPFHPRLHSPRAFDAFLISKGFEKLSHNYFSFSVLPAPFDTIFGFITVPIRKYMEKYTEKNMTLTGNGYIVCARLKNKL